MNPPGVLITILNWNGLQDTLECLESVFKMDYPNFKVLVVDNGSTDNSGEVIRNRYPQVALIENEENLGFTGGNNVGMQYAMKNGFRYVWLLNNDTTVEFDTLSHLVATAESRPKIGLVSPVIYYYDEPHKIQFCGSYIDWENHGNPHAESLESWKEMNEAQTVSLWGTALFIKSDVIKQIGYLDTKYFAYHEDCDYCIRATKAGYHCVLEPHAKVYHKDSRSTSNHTASLRIFLMVRNLYFLWMSHLKGLDKLVYFTEFIARVISSGARLREKGTECIDACFDGAWSAIRGIDGPCDKTVKMPSWLKMIFVFLSSWHPYFWGSLIKGDFVNIFSEAFKRTKAKISKIGG
jgi:GT2 family glycosyltransferase